MQNAQDTNIQTGAKPVRLGTEYFNIIIPQYHEYFLLSKSTKAEYYKWTTIERAQKLPKYILQGLAAGEYRWAETVVRKAGKNTMEKILTNKFGNKVLKNANKVDKPNLKKINGQDIWNGGLMQYSRNVLASYLHAYFTPYIIRQLPEQIFAVPNAEGKKRYIQLEYIFYYPFTARPNENYQDYLNHAYVRQKCFEDTLVKLKVIKSDGPEFVRGGYARYVDIPNEEDRRLEIKIHFCTNNERMH